jgi:hypothetical protein
MLLATVTVMNIFREEKGLANTLFATRTSGLSKGKLR